jgi:putative adenylate-forming enzyme
MIAPPSALRLLAEAARAGTLTLEARPTRIVSVAEVLEPTDRLVIEQAFGVRVDIAYVATEGFIASSCALGGLHLNEDLLVIEKEWLEPSRRSFVPVITDFRRRVTPIIRYRLDDVLSVKSAPCPCGSPHMTLEAIQGRCDDLFRLGSVVVFPDFLRQAIMHASPEIHAYELVQTNASRIEARLSLSRAGSQCVNDIELALRAEIMRVVGALGAPSPEVVVHSEPFQTRALDHRKVRRIRSELGQAS